MKRLILLLLFIGHIPVKADPQLTSWFTAHSGKYARIYQSTANETTGITTVEPSDRNTLADVAVPSSKSAEFENSFSLFVFDETTRASVCSMFDDGRFGSDSGFSLALASVSATLSLDPTVGLC